MKTLSNDCSNLRNDAVKVREELRKEKSQREIYETQFKQTSQENGQCNNQYHVLYQAELLTNVSVIFSSPELKAQVGFSDRLLYVVYPSVCKHFTFSSRESIKLGTKHSLMKGIKTY